MNQRTRTFLIGSAAVVLLGLGTGLVAYYNGGLPTILGQSSDAELQYLPANSAAVGFADVRSIMASEFRQKLVEVLPMPTGEEKDKIQAEFGVDIENDIDTVSAAYLGGGTAESLVVIVRGRFNAGQIETKATEHGAVAEEYKGKKMLVFTESSGDTTAHHSSGGVAFLEVGTLALGEAGAIRQAIDAAESGQDVRKNAELMKVVNDVRGTGNAWFVGKFDQVVAAHTLPDELKSHIPAINTFAVSTHVNGGLSGAVRVDARDETAAQQLRDVVRGALAAGQLISADDPRFNSMLKSMQITGSGNTVGLTFSMPAGLLDIVKGLAAAHGTPRNAPEAPASRPEHKIHK
jgi:hypothetical protein